MEVQEGRRPSREVTVQGLITDYAGLTAYMDIDALRRLMQEGRTVSGAHLSVDAGRWNDFLEAVKKSRTSRTSASRRPCSRASGRQPPNRSPLSRASISRFR